MSNELSLHFQEPGFIAHHGRLTEAEYGRGLDNIVVACVDVAVVCGARMLVGQRINEPYKRGWWICGGKMLPGERREYTAQRIVHREIGLIILDLKRFEDLQLTIPFVWSTRAQLPTEYGCHMVGMYYMLRLDTGEKERMTRTEDFLQHEWVDVLGIARGEPAGIVWHEAMRMVGLAVSQRMNGG